MDIKVIRSNRLSQQTEEMIHCPTCDAPLKPYEVAKHCEMEIEKLKQTENKVIVSDGEQRAAGTSLPNANGSSSKPWTVFRKVQKNRQTRLKLRTRKRIHPTNQACPTCNVSFAEEEIHRHTEQCVLQSNNGINGEHHGMINDAIDSEDGEYEEYEWAGQKRIRTSSLLRGGYASLGLNTVITRKHSNDEDDEDLNVDEDDTQIYGPAQYEESDVIRPEIDADVLEPEEHNVSAYMRQLIAGETSDPSQPALETVSSIFNDGTLVQNNNHETSRNLIEMKKYVSTSIYNSHFPIIESLKAKLRHYENHIQSKFKCLICLDDYRKPAISVSCWHVHCEECWLRSLGARKLCPQCNLITSPKDLRRIYM